MILPDINLLVYAVDESSPFHERANAWLNDVLSSSSTFGLCYPTVLGFTRLVTNRRVFDNPYSVAEATILVDGWAAQPNATFILPTKRHWPLLKALLDEPGATGNLTTDAHISALAIEHGYTVYSNDTDFGRFPSVQWVNPLAEQ